MSKRRVEIIDITKALTIFLVIMGHTTGNLDTPLFRRMIYSFHMPLFFILAGLSIKPICVKTSKEWLTFINKNLKSLIVPYFIWGLIYATFSYQSFKYLAFGSWEALVDMNTLTSLWYLPCFFFSRLVTQLEVNVITKIKTEKTNVLYIVAGLITIIVGLVIPHPEGGCFWCADISVLAAGFILLGIGIKELYIIGAQQKNVFLVGAFVISLGLFLLCTVGRADDLYLSLMCKADNGNIFWFMIVSLLGSAAVLSMAWIIFRISRESNLKFDTKFITFIGTHTLGIYLLHKPFLQEIAVPLVSRCLAGCPFEVVALLASILALIYSIVLCAVIEKYIPQLLGQFPR